MENVCIRVRFAPLIENISKNNLKCCLEIVPLVTCIENIDKINWKHKNDKIEYIVPMNYKIIIKKLKPNRDAIKNYYSCVDLLPSSLSYLDINTADIYRVLSENIVFNKERTDLMALTNLPPLDIKLDKTMHHISKPKNPIEHSDLNSMHIDLIDSLLTLVNISDNLTSLNQPVHIEKDEGKHNYFFIVLVARYFQLIFWGLCS